MKSERIFVILSNNIYLLKFFMTTVLNVELKRVNETICKFKYIKMNNGNILW